MHITSRQLGHMTEGSPTSMPASKGSRRRRFPQSEVLVWGKNVKKDSFILHYTVHLKKLRMNSGLSMTMVMTTFLNSNIKAEVNHVVDHGQPGWLGRIHYRK